MRTSYTTEQLKNILIDAGVVYINYGIYGDNGDSIEELLAPCRGNNEFTVDVDIRNIEANGLKGKTKGMRRKVREDAKLKVRLMSMSLENIKRSIPGSKIESDKVSNGWKITSDNYMNNVTLIGEELGGGYKKITIYNALIDNGFSLAVTEDDEAVVELEFSAHYGEDDDLWDIEDLTAFEGNEESTEG